MATTLVQLSWQIQLITQQTGSLSHWLEDFVSFIHVKYHRNGIIISSRRNKSKNLYNVNQREIQTGPNQLNNYYIYSYSWPAVVLIQLDWPGLYIWRLCFWFWLTSMFVANIDDSGGAIDLLLSSVNHLEPE